MRLQLVTPDRQVLDAEIDEVYAPGVRGQFGILPEHVNFLTALDVGELRYRSGGRDRWVAVAGGVAEVLGEDVTIPADNAAAAEEIDIAALRAETSEIEAALSGVEPGTPEAEDLGGRLAWIQACEAVAART